ncbi:MAG: FAD-dependent oxidoreductase [Methylotenera sp.]|nr:FAD-dependent oxidoreductase [Methylotenera sp.]
MKYKVLIVGGGIVGCTTAMALVKRGYAVTIVERNQIASQTSGESSWAGAGILFPLLPWMYLHEVNQLTMRGAELYEETCATLFKETGLDAELIQSGMLLLPPFDEVAAQNWCKQNQLPFQQVRSGFEPSLANYDGNALWLPTVSQVRPPRLMQALRAWLEKNNVTLLERTELKPLQETQNLSSWETQTGEHLKADIFIVTSGAWSFELLKETASQLNIKPMRGQILLYKPAKNLEHMVYKEGFYMVPRRDGYLLAGSTLEDVGFDPTTTEIIRDQLRAKAAAIMPALKDLPIIKHWSGLRPGTPDNLPTIGAHPNIKNLYLNTGHFRYGLTMAPASAELVANLIV